MAKNKLVQALVVGFAVVLAGCGSSAVDETAGEEEVVEVGVVEPEPVVVVEPIVVDPTAGLEDLIAQTFIYFAFDEAVIGDDFFEILDAHAINLVANRSFSVVLEGHADERGTREYNLALGEERAKSVAEYLQLKGVDKSQIETVSYGEEMPLSMGSTEADYADNRRVEINYQ